MNTSKYSTSLWGLIVKFKDYEGVLTSRDLSSQCL